MHLQRVWNSYIESYDDAREIQESASAYMKTALNGYLMMLEHGRPFFKFRSSTHSIDSYSKSILLSIFKEYPELYELNVHPFRNVNEVVRVFWLLEMAYFYNCPLKIEGHPKTWFNRKLIQLGIKKMFSYEFQSKWKKTKFKQLPYFLQKYSPYCFCCNNLSGVIGERTMKYLDGRFPEKSSFEI